MAKVRLSVEEMISTIKHSRAPTLLAEGVDDIILLRRIEDRFSDVGLSVFPTGGRDFVLAVFDRRNELAPDSTVLFMADQDTWIYSQVPPCYRSARLFLTDGYSVENDLYRDGDLEDFMFENERRSFHTDLSRFLRWYALALSRHLENSQHPIALHPSTLLDDPDRFSEQNALQENEVYPSDLFDALLADYRRLLRGKSLIALLIRQLSSHTRNPKHSKKSLMEYGAVAQGVFVDRIIDWLSPTLERARKVA